MTTKQIALGLLLLLVSCKKEYIPKTSSVTKTEKISVKNSEEEVIGNEDSFKKDSTSIKNKKFTVLWNANNFYIIKNVNDTIHKLQDSGINFAEFVDFDEDSYKDILVYFHANNPTHELGLFDPATNTFKFIKNYTAYSGAIKIKGSNYYYSYHRSGCADSNWDSDLIVIKNYKAYKIGNIHTIGCEDEKKNGIFIYKVNDNAKTLVKYISRKAGYYNDKMDFIEGYWKKNYKQFE